MAGEEAIAAVALGLGMRMKPVLLIHTEAQYFGGAERMLMHHVAGLLSAGVPLVLALGRGSRLGSELPANFKFVELPNNTRFSPRRLLQQHLQLRRVGGTASYAAVHAWAARDWELASLFGALQRIPAIGTLHDHPAASYIGRSRRVLMRLCARWGLNRVVCVSEAVRRACLQQRYRAGRLEVVHNGIPEVPGAATRSSIEEPVRLGWLGTFSELKGFVGLFEILDWFDREARLPWSLTIGGEARHPAERELFEMVRHKYVNRAWWSKVRFAGWVAEPVAFMKSLDLLLFTSKMFDSLPNVLLECGRARLPVLAAQVGGVAEIVVGEPARSGWMFDAGDWCQAGQLLRDLMRNPAALVRTGENAGQRIAIEFSIERMIQSYENIYRDVQAI